jgi:hypothetical protein
VSVGITEHPSRDDEVDCALVLVVEDLAVPEDHRGDVLVRLGVFMDGDGGAQTAALPSERVCAGWPEWSGGMRVVSVENTSRSTHRPSGTFRVRVDGTPTDLIPFDKLEAFFTEHLAAGGRVGEALAASAA